jgi:hypothetical protein
MQRCDTLTREMERNREAYLADADKFNALLEAAGQQKLGMQASLTRAIQRIEALEAENACLQATIRGMQSGDLATGTPAAHTPPPTRLQGPKATGPTRTYKAAAMTGMPAPADTQGPTTRGPQPAQPTTELDRLKNVVIFNVRGCPLPRTAAQTTQQIEQVMTMPTGARIRRLARSREGDVEGPVLVTCRTPQQAFQLISALSTTEIDCGGLSARHDLTVEERAAKAARRCLNDQYVELVQRQGLRPQWRGPMRTELWVHTPTGDTMVWQRVLPGPPTGAPSGPTVGTPAQQQLITTTE